MKITIIHGQAHKGSTYNVAHLLAKKVGGEVTEFFLPRDFGEFCLGCTKCFVTGEANCPHYEKLKPITEALDAADLIILASPVYVYHCTGAMKALLDHYGYRWMAHRPEECMFKKQGVVISTAAGGGTKSANKDMADSLFFWGIPKIYKIGLNVFAINWDKVSPGKMKKIEKVTTKVAAQIRDNHGKVKPGLNTKKWFTIMHFAQKKGWNKADVDYWKAKGWTGKRRPW